MQQKIKHFMYVPFTGLGLHNGFRGNTWLENRIAIFKQFVIPSLKAQTNQNFTVWISWRYEEKFNPIVQEFRTYLKYEMPGGIVHTFSGVCFYDDKYPDEIARNKLIDSIHGALPELFDHIADCDYVYMTIQPSDDLYHREAVASIQKVLEDKRFSAVGFKDGYICNYNTKEVAEYNPETNPPFYTFKFPKNVFIDPLSHAQFTALKKDSGKYKAGTPCPSHEYVGECVPYAIIGDLRGFLVGTHGANISTTFNIPYRGPTVESYTLKNFGIYDVPGIEIKVTLTNKIINKLPYRAQRKIRYILNEWKPYRLSTWLGLIK